MQDGLTARVNVHGKITPEVRAQQRKHDEMWAQWEREQQEALAKLKVSSSPKQKSPAA
jgi:hypothetical protein